MYLLIIQLFKMEYKDDLLLAMNSCGIKKGNTIEGQNLELALERDFPLFTCLIKSDLERERFSMLIISVVDEKRRAKDLIHLLKEADIDIIRENIMRIILISADMVIDNTLQWEANQ